MHRPVRPHYSSREVEAILNEEIADSMVAEIMARVKRDAVVLT